MRALSALDRKLLRDLWRLRGQVLAVAAVAMCGIAAFVCLNSAYESLQRSQRDYYASHRFADVFAVLKRAPEAVLDQVRALPGVAEADGRVVFDAALDVPGLDEPANGRLVSLPRRPGSGLNRVFVRSGRLPGAHQLREAVVSEAFALANGLRPGATLGAVINGRKERLRITGIALSPEYINEMKGTSFPDNRRFGVLWMDRDALAGALDMRGALNDITVSLAPRASEPAVIAALDTLLARYGALGAYGRKDQLSHNFLDNELAQARVTATVMPAIFLSVVAFLTHNVLLRLTSLQRGQIGLMKSFGYTGAEIGWHYAKFALATVLAGAVAGIALGAWLGHGLAMLYTEFYHFPRLAFGLSGTTVAAALGIATATAAGGALLAVRRVLRLAPAEALRGAEPLRFRPGPLERLGLQRFMSLPLRIILRNLERRPLRTALSVAGLAFGVAVTLSGQFMFDALDEIIRVQFRSAQRDDLTVNFNQPLGSAAAQALASLPGILRVEPFRAAPVRLRFAQASKRTVVLGLPPRRELRRLLAPDGAELALPPAGIVLGQMLAASLGVRPGQRLTVEFLDGQRRTATAPVVATLDESIGMLAYMDARDLARMAQEGPLWNGAWLAADPAALPRLYRTLKGVPVLAAVTLREVTLQSFLDTMARNMRMNTRVLVSFACVIAFGMVYNAARIALSEHAVELASLRILGFTQGEVGRLLLGEQAVLTLAALPVGCALGYGLAALLAELLSQELFRIPLIVSRRTLALSVGVVLAAAVVSGWLVWQRMRRLDLIAVLKTRE
ncbi:MAG: ABC transporter permease [Telluria sp.]